MKVAAGLFVGLTFTCSLAGNYDVKVSPIVRESAILLEIEIENRSDQSMTFRMSHLPWGMESNLVLVPLVTEPFVGPLQPYPGMEGLPTGRRTVRPGGKLTGRVNVTDRFPQLRSAQGHDIVLFWYTEFAPMDGEKRGFGGFVELQLK